MDQIGHLKRFLVRYIQLGGDGQEGCSAGYLGITHVPRLILHITGLLVTILILLVLIKTDSVKRECAKVVIRSGYRLIPVGFVHLDVFVRAERLIHPSRDNPCTLHRFKVLFSPLIEFTRRGHPRDRDRPMTSDLSRFTRDIVRVPQRCLIRYICQHLETFTVPVTDHIGWLGYCLGII